MLNNDSSILMSRILLFLILLITFSNPILAQRTRIKKVLDSNLFELSDSSLIKLSGVDVPNINHPNLQLQKVGLEAYYYAKQMLEGKKFTISFTNDNKLRNSNYSLVSIIREYPLITRDYTEEYLLKGFGKFFSNTTNLDSNKYIYAEQEANEENKGIWEISNEFEDNTLDKTFISFEPIIITELDSILSTSKSVLFLEKFSPTERVLTEILAAPIGGIGVGLLGMLAGGGLSSFFGAQGWDALGYVILGGYIGYSTGNALAVYYIAKNGDRDVTLGFTILSSFVGAAISGGIQIFYSNRNNNNLLNYSPLILPGLASILYVNLIAEKKSNQVIKLENDVVYSPRTKNSLTHKDFYNSKKLIELNLFRIIF